MKLNVKEILAEGKELKEFLKCKKTREVFEFNSEHFFLREAKMSSNKFAHAEIGKFDFKTLTFTRLTEQEIKDSFEKEYEPILFFKRTFEEDKIYGLELPCYKAIYIFKINGKYYCHEHWDSSYSSDRRGFISIIRNIYNPRYWFEGSAKEYISSPLEDGTKYAVRIYFDEDFSHRFYSNEVNGVIYIEMSEITEEGKFKISKKELPKLIKAFNIINSETINLLEKVLYNNGILYPSTRIFFDNPNPYRKDHYVLNRKRLEDFKDFLSNFEKLLNSKKGE